MKRKEIAVGVRMPSRSGYLSRMLAELVEDGLIERTIPDKPNSSQQRYRLTEKGQQVVRGTTNGYRAVAVKAKANNRGEQKRKGF